ncbi:hypothetical protein AKJ09_00049 [Labilithrix luteola]|uniref:Uncharacterized protein n=1 Tax=Labilithrix luteola TaxID=1391654 RepID=A0A0K1PIN7_9BACT|nr:hypothetical protein AKJ09_00049 [Labilithrix luteola]
MEYVADLMRALKYRTGVSNKALMVEWDLPKNVVGEIVTEASRIVRAELTDHDRVISKITVALDRVIDDAIASGDNASVVKAAQVWAQVSGAGAPQRVELHQDLAALSPEQLAARKAELLARLTAKPADPPFEVIEVKALPPGGEE